MTVLLIEELINNRILPETELQKLSLYDLYCLRKSLIYNKGKRVRRNKPYTSIQMNINKVNYFIKMKGGY